MKFPQKAIERFNIKVNKTNDCHVWNAARQKQGYGMFSIDGKSMPAHRFSYLLHKGNIAENMVVHQTCENNGCVNPNHLELQTKSQNKKSYSSVRVSKEMFKIIIIWFLECLHQIIFVCYQHNIFYWAPTKSSGEPTSRGSCTDYYISQINF